MWLTKHVFLKDCREIAILDRLGRNPIEQVRKIIRIMVRLVWTLIEPLRNPADSGNRRSSFCDGGTISQPDTDEMDQSQADKPVSDDTLSLTSST